MYDIRGNDPGYRPDAQHQLLDKLKTSLSECSEGNRSQLFGAREALRKLSDRIGEGAWKSLEPVCDATQELLGHLLRRGTLEEGDAIGIASELVTFVERMLNMPAPVIRTASQGTIPVNAAPRDPEPIVSGSVSVNAVNESRLGEILIKVGKIDREQLEQALVTQKVTRKRLGEVLIAMECISPADLQEAFEHQRRETLRLAGGLAAAPGNSLSFGRPTPPKPLPPPANDPSDSGLSDGGFLRDFLHGNDPYQAG